MIFALNTPYQWWNMVIAEWSMLSLTEKLGLNIYPDKIELNAYY